MILFRETYNEYVLSKLLRSKQRLAFAKMMIDEKHEGIPNDVIVKILKSLKVPPLTEETIDKTNKILVKTLQEELSKEIEQSLRNKFKGQKLDDMIEFYQKQLKNPDLKSNQRKAYRKQKRTRKRNYIKSRSSDLDTSELELKRAIKMSIQEANSGSKKKKKKTIKNIINNLIFIIKKIYIIVYKNGRRRFNTNGR